MNGKIKLGDSHNGKCTELIDENGKKYIIKYRNALTERVWALFLNGLIDLGFCEFTRVAEILEENEEYHKEKIVENAPTDKEGIKKYYFRLGILIFFTYLLGSNDLHCENIVANGEYPVIVDLETLLTAKEKRKQTEYSSTVLKSHLLPSLYNGIDKSGGTGEKENCRNNPFVENEKIEMFRFADEILNGFNYAYDFSLPRKKEIGELIKYFSECSFRVLIRPTDVYYYIISKIEKSESREETASSLLSRAYLKDIDKDRINKARKILNSEIKAVLANDIPIFHVKGNGTALYSGKEIAMEEFFETSPVETALNKLKSLSEKDKITQAKIIELAYALKMPISEIREDECTDLIKKTMKELDRCFVPDYPSSFIYLSHTNDGLFFFRSVGYGLYNGITGILCCYAALYRKSKDEALIPIIKYHIAELENVFRSARRISISDSSCSLSDGIGGIISGLVHIHDLTGIEEAYSLAVKIAEKIDASAVNIGRYDVLSGAGGLCLQLPKLPEKIALPIARAIAPVYADADVMLCGTGHGKSGVALSLAALGYVMKSDEFDNQILKLLNEENQYYDKEKCNWRDLRDSEVYGFMKGYCSGAPGIGMARKKMLSYTENGKIADICNKDIERVKEFLQKEQNYKRATLCCGESSFAVCASYLGVKVKDNLNSAINAQSARFVRAFKTAELNPTLMQGVAGVGYASAMRGFSQAGEMLI